MSDTASDSATDTATGVDRDGDGFFAITTGGDDCDDGNAAVHPGATEACNLRDDNCDGAIDEGCPETLDPGASTDGISWSCAAVGSSAPPPALLLALASVGLLLSARRLRRTRG